MSKGRGSWIGSEERHDGAQTYKEHRIEQLEELAELCDDLLGKRRPCMIGSKHSFLPDNDAVRGLLKRIESTLNRADGRAK